MIVNVWEVESRNREFGFVIIHGSGDSRQPDNNTAAIIDNNLIEPIGCTLVWLFLLMSMMVHAMHYCGSCEYESSEDDEDEIPTMYT